MDTGSTTGGAEELPPHPAALHELYWRGLVKDHTEGALEALAAGPLTFYVGFDPTAASLHVGSLFQLMNMARLQRLGHKPLAIVGGGTGMIGDPSGKTVERQLLTEETVAANVAGMRRQIESVLDFTGSNAAEVIDNGEWLNKMGFIEFMRDVGKHLTVNYMLAKDSVKARLGSESGISFTEFSYMLLQAYDFVYLHDHKGCTLQFGGSDQYGNIVAGCELIRRMRGKQGHGLTFPLIVTASGVKFGKTEAGAVWLDPELTSPYRFYQFWLNTPDADAVLYLKYFTWLSEAEVGELAAELAASPEKRECQKALARAVTTIVHGAAALAQAEQATAVLFGGSLDGLSASAVAEIFAEVPGAGITADQLGGEGLVITEALVAAGLAKSKGEARRLVEGGGVYVNNHPVDGPYRMLSYEDAIEGSCIVLRKGKKDYALLSLV
jgi:tyrosyl-tRNA synthetase